MITMKNNLISKIILFFVPQVVSDLRGAQERLKVAKLRHQKAIKQRKTEININKINTGIEDGLHQFKEEMKRVSNAK